MHAIHLLREPKKIDTENRESSQPPTLPLVHPTDFRMLYCDCTCALAMEA
jgi:hypothetical protein